MPRTPKVALLIETSRGYGRALLRGIVRYARLHGPWGFYVTPGDFAQVLPRMQSLGRHGHHRADRDAECGAGHSRLGFAGDCASTLPRSNCGPITPWPGSARLLLIRTGRGGLPPNTCSIAAFAIMRLSARAAVSGQIVAGRASAPESAKLVLSLMSTIRRGAGVIASGSASSQSWPAGWPSCPARSA